MMKEGRLASGATFRAPIEQEAASERAEMPCVRIKSSIDKSDTEIAIAAAHDATLMWDQQDELLGKIGER